MIKEEIAKIIRKVSGEDGVVLDVPVNSSFGHYSTNIAMVLAKREGKNPKELADGIASKILSEKQSKALFEKVEVAGPGFINLYLKNDVLLDNLIQIGKEKEKYGTSKTGKGKVVVIDYSAPNIAKPFGIGHLRSTIIGQALYNLFDALGYKVIGDNHLGDWGTQFGKLLYMIDSQKTADYSIENLEKLYVDFHKSAADNPKLEEAAREWFKKLEDGDKKAVDIWKKCVDVSMEQFQKIYDLLGVSIDYALGESSYQDLMKKMLKDENLVKHIQTGEDGKSKVINLEKYGIKTPLMFLKSDGATTYATRDLATIVFREKKWNPDIYIYEVGAEQSLYFKQLFAAAKLIGLLGDEKVLVHTAHGLYLDTDGKKFSTRKGKTVTLEEVLGEAVQKAKQLGSKDEKTAREVGIGAIKYFDLLHSVQSDVVFDWTKILAMEGNSGPYLQYSVARTNSVVKRSGTKTASKDTKAKMNKEEKNVACALLYFQEVLEEAALGYAPNLLCNYLYELASKYNTFYNKHRIIGGDNEQLRLDLTKATGQVLKNGLKLLGIETPEKM